MVLEEFDTSYGERFEVGDITSRNCGSKWVTIAKHPTTRGLYRITQVRVQPPRRIRKWQRGTDIKPVGIDS